MTDEILKQLQQTFGANQLIGAIASGSLVVWVIANIKGFYYYVRSWITDLISFTVTNLYEDRGYCPSAGQRAFNAVVSEAPAVWERHVSLGFGNEDVSGEASTYKLSVKLICGKICRVTRTWRCGATKNNVITEIRVFFARKKHFMTKLAAEVEKARERKESERTAKNSVTVWADGMEFSKYRRSIESVFTPDGAHLRVLEGMKKFLAGEATYRALNAPYKFCCCLYGEPGCGKTSTILAAASELNMDIVYVNLAKTDTQSLVSVLSSSDCRRSIFVFEDIDAVCSPPTGEREGRAVADGISLSDLLNLTDGLLSSDGSICVFTTNHAEKLDPAFLRAGRMNLTAEFRSLDAATAAKMYENEMGKPPARRLRNGIKPAELQDAILLAKTGQSDEQAIMARFGA